MLLRSMHGLSGCRMIRPDLLVEACPRWQACCSTQMRSAVAGQAGAGIASSRRRLPVLHLLKSCL